MRRAALIVMHRGSPSPKVEVGHWHVAPGQAPLVDDAPHDGRAVVAEQHDAVELVLDDGARLRARDAEDERELLVAELRRDVARVASPNSQPVSWEEAIVYSYQYLVSKLDDDEYPIPWLNKPRGAATASTWRRTSRPRSEKGASARRVRRASAEAQPRNTPRALLDASANAAPNRQASRETRESRRRRRIGPCSPLHRSASH